MKDQMENYARTGKAPEPSAEAKAREHNAKIKAALAEEAKKKKGAAAAVKKLDKEQKAAAFKSKRPAVAAEVDELVANAKEAAEAIAVGATVAFKTKHYEQAALGWGEALACLRAAKADARQAGVRDCQLSWHNNRAMALLQLERSPRPPPPPPARPLIKHTRARTLISTPGVLSRRSRWNMVRRAWVYRAADWTHCRWAEAEDEATEVLMLDPANLKAQYRRGTARAALAGGDYAADAAAERGGAEKRLQETLEGAIRDFEKVVVASPENAKAMGALTKCRHQLVVRTEVAAVEVARRNVAEDEMTKVVEEESRTAAKAELQATQAKSAKLATMPAEEQEKVRQEAEKTYWDYKMAEMAKSSTGTWENDVDGAGDEATEPKHTVVDNGDTLAVTVQLPLARHIKGFDIGVGDDGDEMRVLGGGYHLVLRLPTSVDVDSVRAKFDKKIRVLTLTAGKVEEISTSSMR
jgi:hypothetical protein